MSHDHPKNFPISWQEMHRDSKALAWRLLGKAPWKGVISVTRGGMFPAVIVARELDLLMIETACVSGYNDITQTQHAATLLKPLNESITTSEGEGWLVIDDLVDTGKTFELLRKILPKAHYATVYAKPDGRPLVDTYVTEVSQDTWIFFPWDIDLQYVTPMAAAHATSKK